MSKVEKRKNAISIGVKLKDLRISEKKTQLQMSKALQISESAWRMYELGERIPNDETKLKISAYFDMTVDELFFKH